MKVDTTKASLAGLLLGAFSLLLAGCGNKGDLVLVRKPATLDLPSPVSVPEQQQTRANAEAAQVGSEGVVLDLSDAIPEQKKKKKVGE